MKTINKNEIEEKIIQRLRTIQDLELPINIYDLGLIYKIEITDNSDALEVNIETTVINSRCNSTKSFSDEIINVVKSVSEVETCNVKFVYSPKWEVTMINEKGLEMLRNAS